MRDDDNSTYNVKEPAYKFLEEQTIKVVKWNIGTTDHIKYCYNCLLDTENSKRRRVYNIYKCNGHTI